MTNRERVLTALDHREPDRVPLDLASTQVTGISITAYRNLREYLGLEAKPPIISDLVQQICIPHDDVMAALKVDTRGLFALTSSNLPLPVGGAKWRELHKDAGSAWDYRDEWGCTHRFPKKDALYYSLVESPLPGFDVSVENVNDLPLPDGGEEWRTKGLHDRASAFRKQEQAVVVKSICAGMVEMGERIRGMENFLVDLLANPEVADRLMERLLEAKMNFWRRTLGEVGDLVDVVMEADDYGTQESMLVSPDTFRKMVKPKLKRLFSGIKELAPHARILFHSCGSVRPLIPDFIEIGVDILNPIHISAQGMEPKALKADFGDELSFWGGGVETQKVLPTGSPADVKEDVKRNVEALAPGGGWVFNTVHNIQADVPPENIMAMYEALWEYGGY